MHRLTLCLVASLLGTACAASSSPVRRSQPSCEPSPVSTTAATRADSDPGMLAREAPPAAGSSSGSEEQRADKPAGGAPGAGPASTELDSDERDRKLVKNASLTIEVEDEDLFESAVAKGVEIARELDGQVTTNQTRDYISFKVPSERLDEALAAVEQSWKVNHRQVTTQDAMANYVDLQGRIAELKALRSGVSGLVAHAQNIEEMREIGETVETLTRDLEVLEDQMRVLESQTTYATVTVSFRERVRRMPSN